MNEIAGIGTYASMLLSKSDAELDQEKRQRQKVPAMCHLTGMNVFHSLMAKDGNLSESEDYQCRKSTEKSPS